MFRKNSRSELFVRFPFLGDKQGSVFFDTKTDHILVIYESQGLFVARLVSGNRVCWLAQSGDLCKKIFIQKVKDYANSLSCEERESMIMRGKTVN